MDHWISIQLVSLVSLFLASDVVLEHVSACDIMLAYALEMRKPVVKGTDLEKAFVDPQLIVLQGIQHHHLSFGPPRQAEGSAPPTTGLALLLYHLIDEVDAGNLLKCLAVEGHVTSVHAQIDISGHSNSNMLTACSQQRLVHVFKQICRQRASHRYSVKSSS